MGINWGKSSCPYHGLSLQVWDMLACSLINDISLCQTKINNVDQACILFETQKEIIWLYVTMNQESIACLMQYL